MIPVPTGAPKAGYTISWQCLSSVDTALVCLALDWTVGNRGSSGGTKFGMAFFCHDAVAHLLVGNVQRESEGLC